MARTVPRWPRPGWLIEMAEESRYPNLWEAVRTTWNRDPSEYTTPAYQLVEHANYILMNQFRDELGLSVDPPEDRGWMISEGAVRGASVMVDGSVTPAIEIDTDPFIYAIGFALSVDVNVTVVLPRAELPFVHLALARHASR